METYEIKSTEEISQNHLKNFILTNLEKEEILLSSNSYIYASFLKELNSYQLIVFDKNSTNIPEIFSHKCKNDNELLITERYFCLYKEKKVYFYQEIKEKLNEKQILEFVKSSFNIEKLSITNEINKNKKQEKQYSFIGYKKSHLFKFFLLYILVLFLVLLCYFSSNNKVEDKLSIENLKKRIETQKQNSAYSFVSSKIVDLFYHAKQKDIKILSIQLQNKSFLLELSSLQKKSIYEFFNNYKTSINSFKYDELIGGYKVNANISFIRK
ncbi:hypothetical protein CRV01_07445 [Arcobacter sp. CECT 8983]|uniref:hypothetical protein n=1 Tax=Arcobacter sp. CECT 8983 TaxID=2044508 RepID=UPI00100A3F74|nr:hypothetical protein [Arcobacter sp. CECT 8983]RXJ89700.1 hypothetical protein CRV01_07445 [Arcobacter sp. CECT 8983]